MLYKNLEGSLFLTVRNSFLCAKYKNIMNMHQSKSISMQFNRESYQNFDSMVNVRRNEAKKSAVLRFPNTLEYCSIYNFCLKFGPIEKCYKFNTDLHKIDKKMLIEYQSESSLQNLLDFNLCSTPGLWIKLPFLELNDKILTASCSTTGSTNLIHEKVIDLQCDLLNKKHQQEFRNCISISEQMICLYNNFKVTDLGWRIRFLICRKVEYFLPLYMSHSRVLPFGSSVNTFGNSNCDLDMSIDATINKHKELPPNKTLIIKQLQSIVYPMIEHNMGFQEINRILKAKVPIVKCRHTLTKLECDITSGQKSGYYMSEILYTYGCCDPRVRPFIYTLRWWAKSMKITPDTSPSNNVTNFSLTLLGLFFLMNTAPKVIQPLCVMNNSKDVKSFKENGNIHHSTQSLKDIPLSTNEDSLEDLLMNFFVFYSIKSKNKSFSLISGRIESLKSNVALYIENPIQPDLNVSKNVSHESFEHFQNVCLKSKCLLQKGSSEGILAFVNERKMKANPPVFKSNLNRMFTGIDLNDQLEKNSFLQESIRKNTKKERNNSVANQNKKSNYRRLNYKYSPTM